MFLLGNTAGNEDAEVADRFMDRIDDRLSIRADVIDAVVEIENPSKRLLWRSDVVALRAEHDDRRTDVAQVDRCSIRRFDTPTSQIVADKQLIDDELDFLLVQVDVAAPPLFRCQVP